MTCTTLDHVYPSTVPGTPCYCGDRTWGGAPRRAATRRLKAGTPVTVRSLSAAAVVEAVTSDCGDVIYRLDRILAGRRLFDRDELQED